ncbi:MAG: hypothetical protein PHQ40_03040 [Anaerolineaceae bacterium]|nr:hypothetical protein [Anaerolineaceae bacterium]
MIKLPLGQLEEARSNPTSFREKMGTAKGGGKWGYFNALREAIRQFHKMGDNANAGLTYLEQTLDRFSNQRKCQETVDQLAWYIDEYQRRGWFTRDTYRRIIVPIEDETIHVQCTGEICRLDIIPAGGYAAWSFRSKDPSGWKNELRMPIIQYVTARLLGVPYSEITVGMVSFGEQFVDFHSYKIDQINAAYAELIDLARYLSP